MNEVILVHKQPLRANAIRISRAYNIPEFLKDSIKVNGNMIEVRSKQLSEVGELGSIVMYEKSAISGKYNCRFFKKNDGIELIEKQGVLYNKPAILKAQLITDKFPEFLRGANISRYSNYSWSIETCSGIVKGYIGKAYWLYYGLDNTGKPVGSILRKCDIEYFNYLVCDADEKDLGWLHVLDDIWMSGEEKEILSPNYNKVFVTQNGAKRVNW